MTREAPVTAVQEALRRRGRLRIPLYVLLLVVFLIGIVGTVLGGSPALAGFAASHAALRRYRRAFQIRLDRRRAVQRNSLPHLARAAEAVSRRVQGPQRLFRLRLSLRERRRRPAARPADRHRAPRLPRRRGRLVQLRDLSYRHRERARSGGSEGRPAHRRRHAVQQSRSASLRRASCSRPAPTNGSRPTG